MLSTKFNAWQKANTSGEGNLDDAFLVLADGGFVEESVVDGPGLRCTIFVQGCPHNCPGCHNPATHAFSGGQTVPVQQLYSKIKALPLCRGVTLSGGEPFCQSLPLAKLAAMLKADGYNIAAYSGFTFEQIFSAGIEQRSLLENIDILVDGPYIEAERREGLHFRGSANQRIIDVPKSLAAGAAVLSEDKSWVGE